MNTTKFLSLAAGLSFVLTGAINAAPAPAAASKDKSYPKKTCIVTDNDLGSMGPVITRTHKGQQVKFCCKPCVKKFDKNPGKYLKKI